jgi:hypothetical protein
MHPNHPTHGGAAACDMRTVRTRSVGDHDHSHCQFNSQQSHVSTWKFTQHVHRHCVATSKDKGPAVDRPQRIAAIASQQQILLYKFRRSRQIIRISSSIDYIARDRRHTRVDPHSNYGNGIILLIICTCT